MKNIMKYLPFIIGSVLGIYFTLSINLGKSVTIATYEYNPAFEAKHINIPSDETGFGIFKKKDLEEIGQEMSKLDLGMAIMNETNLLGFSIKFRDSTYNDINKDQYKSIIRSWEQYLFDHDIKYIFEAFDCDNYSNAFKAFVELYNHKWGTNIAVGKVVVHNKEEFGFVQGSNGSYHMLNIICVGGEFIIVEPQNSISTELSRYPNKNTLLEIEI